MTTEKLTVLEEAIFLVQGDRHASYGTWKGNFGTISRLATAMTGKDISPRDAILTLIALKFARHAHSPKRDNLVDAAGYIAGLAILDGIDEAEDSGAMREVVNGFDVKPKPKPLPLPK